jgi:hypothetical protein
MVFRNERSGHAMIHKWTLEVAISSASFLVLHSHPMSMKPAAETRKPYGGATRSLVIALDVGTTFSGVSYAVLEPGEVPKIHGVTR